MEKNYVYVVGQDIDYCNYNTVAVYATKEQAEAHVGKTKEWWMEYGNGLYCLHVGSFRVEEVPIK